MQYSRSHSDWNNYPRVFDAADVSENCTLVGMGMPGLPMGASVVVSVMAVDKFNNNAGSKQCRVFVHSIRSLFPSITFGGVFFLRLLTRWMPSVQ